MYHILFTPKPLSDDIAASIIAYALHSTMQCSPIPTIGGADDKALHDIVSKLEYVVSDSTLFAMPLFYIVFQTTPDLVDVHGDAIPYTCTVYNPSIDKTLAQNHDHLIIDGENSMGALMQSDFEAVIHPWIEGDNIERHVTGLAALTLVANDEIDLISTNGIRYNGINALTFVSTGSTFMNTLVNAYRKANVIDDQRKPTLTLIQGGLTDVKD